MSEAGPSQLAVEWTVMGNVGKVFSAFLAGTEEPFTVHIPYSSNEASTECKCTNLHLHKRYEVIYMFFDSVGDRTIGTLLW